MKKYIVNEQEFTDLGAAFLYSKQCNKPIEDLLDVPVKDTEVINDVKENKEEETKVDTSNNTLNKKVINTKKQ